MSRLAGLARLAAEFARRRLSRDTQADDEHIDARPDSEDRASRLVRQLSDLIFGSKRRSQQQPPARPPGDPVPTQAGAPPQQPPDPPDAAPGAEDPEDFDDIQLLGRDASYDEADWNALRARMVRVSSSNVYAYAWETESRTTGILYVTFLKTNRDGTRGPGPGPTYAYYTVPTKVYHRFAEECRSSPGSAVWDQLRIRGTVWGHQFTYRLVHAEGEYIPRKATRRGFRTRHLPDIGVGRRSFRRSTLPEELFPDRSGADRSESDRGDA